MKKLKTFCLALMLFGVVAPVVEAVAEVPDVRKAVIVKDWETGEEFVECVRPGSNCLI